MKYNSFLNSTEPEDGRQNCKNSLYIYIYIYSLAGNCKTYITYIKNVKCKNQIEHKSHRSVKQKSNLPLDFTYLYFLLLKSKPQN